MRLSTQGLLHAMAGTKGYCWTQKAIAQLHELRYAIVPMRCTEGHSPANMLPTV